MNELNRFRMNAPRVIHQLIDGEAVLLHLDRGFYFCLDEIGSLVLQVMENGGDAGRMAEAVAERYDGDGAAMQADVFRLLDEMLEEDLIRPLPPEEATAATKGLPLPADSRQPYFSPRLEKFTDLQELLLLDPIHEVEETGWPNRKA